MDKALKISLMRSDKFNPGLLLSHVQIDSTKVFEFSYVIPLFVACPVEIIFGMIMLYSLVGIMFLPGFLAMILLAYANLYMSKIFFKIENKFIASRNGRVKKTSEVLKGIRYFKMSGLESFLSKQVKKISTTREDELESFKESKIWKVALLLSNKTGTLLIICPILVTYLFAGYDLTPEIIFPLITTFSLIQTPIRQLPQIISFMIKTLVSLDKIQNFMLEKEIEQNEKDLQSSNTSDTAIDIQNMNFYWREKSSTTNSNLFKLENLTLKKSQQENLSLLLESKYLTSLINIRIGCGKSSVLYSLINEMFFDDVANNSKMINGSTAFVGDNPWILNRSLKDNILFGKKFDEKRYNQVLECTCLSEDLKYLPNGDETQIGERGINLSGGQKARVSLARACYLDADIIIMDDPLSALDAQVGKEVLEKCLLKFLKNKTRVIATHKLETLQYMDITYILHEGKIIKQGSFQEIIQIPEYQNLAKKISQTKKNIIEEHSISKENPQVTKADTNNKEDSLQSKQAKDDLILNEESHDQNMGLKNIKLLTEYLGGNLKLLEIITTTIPFLFLSLASSYWLDYWTKANVTGSYNFFYLLIYFLIGVLGGVSYFFRAYKLLISTNSSAQILHDRMVKAILRSPINTFFDRIPTGRILNRLVGDLNSVDDGLFSSMNGLISDFCTVLQAIIISLHSSGYWVAPSLLLFVRIIWNAQRKFVNLKKSVIKLESTMRSPIVSFFNEVLNGLPTIRAYSKENWMQSQFHGMSDEYLKNKILKFSLVSWFQIQLTTSSILLLIVSTIPLIFYSNHKSPIIGTIGLLIYHLSQLDFTLFSFLNSESEFESRLISLERCYNFTELKPELDISSKERIELKNNNWPEKGSISFKDYSVNYRPGLPLILKNLNLAIKNKERIGIVGRTGSGKSTMFLSLLRVLEASDGIIEIDGVDISQVNLDTLRQNITIIPQDPILIDGTLRENMNLLTKFDDNEIWDVLRKIKFDNKFSDQGLNFKIKEGGENLSAGERQLLCIARAILTKNKIVLIDEATSNIDPKNEGLILAAIKEQFTECTVLSIAHRLKTIMDSDRIMVMDEGRTIEFDSPENLLKNTDSHFYKLWANYNLSNN